MKPFATKALPAKSAKNVPPSLRPMSEAWIQRELDVAALNAQKNRSIHDSVDGRSQSASKKPACLGSSPNSYSAPHKPTPETLVVNQQTSLMLQESTISDKGHPLIFKQEVVLGHSTDISSLHTHFQSMISGWGGMIKQAIFHEDLGLNEDRLHAPQLLILL